MSAYNWQLAPPAVRSAETRGGERSDVPKLGSWKPHMERRPGETVTEWRERLAWSCYACGQRFEREQRQALNDHEDAHVSH